MNINKDKFYKIIFYFFILSLIPYALVFFDKFLPFEFLTGGSCTQYKICGAIDINYIFWPLFLINLILGILLIFFKKNIKKLIILVLFAIFIFSFIFTSNDVRCRNYNTKRKADLFQIKLAQELYYDAHNRFADNFDELIANKILGEYLKEPGSGKIYSDEDGFGLDGGDNNPNTWSVRSYINEPEYEYCLKTSEGYWFVCDQSHDRCFKQ